MMAAAPTSHQILLFLFSIMAIKLRRDGGFKLQDSLLAAFVFQINLPFNAANGGRPMPPPIQNHLNRRFPGRRDGGRGVRPQAGGGATEPSLPVPADKYGSG